MEEFYCLISFVAFDSPHQPFDSSLAFRRVYFLVCVCLNCSCVCMLATVTCERLHRPSVNTLAELGPFIRLLTTLPSPIPELMWVKMRANESLDVSHVNFDRVPRVP